MTDLDSVRIAVHQNNINRYRRLLQTKLTEIERQYVERRLAEERHSLDLLTARQHRRKQSDSPRRSRKGLALSAKQPDSNCPQYRGMA
jgi:hypothetical protein